MLHVRLLGTFGVRDGNKAIGIQSRPAQSLFAFLILNAGTAYRREKLAGQLWPDSTEEQARAYLRHTLWRVRKALQTISASGFLLADDLTISFDADSNYWLDAAALEKIDEAGPIDPLAEALSEYHGELLPGFYDDWVVLERERLQATYERKVGCLLENLQAARRWQEVLEWAEKWIALGQKPEAAYRYLMTAYAAGGDMAKASAAFDRCAKSLAELGVEPSEQTRELHKNLKAGRLPAQDQPTSGRAKRTAKAYGNVPAPLTGFIGREHELVELARGTDEHRVITLTGPGGVGKTRLAIRLAGKVRARFKDGVCWVELAPLSDPSLVPLAIANAMQLQESPNQSLMGAVKQSLLAKQLLLVLDNCEHLIMACAQVVESLVEACPNLKILSTSREALGISGEKLYEVPCLSVPKPGLFPLADLMEYESVRLFVERALAVQPNFQLTEQNAGAVYQICKRLDGIPLALELAAARAKLITVEHIADRLNDRFNLLTQGSRTALPRHQTLRATLDWSCDQLPEDVRVLFRRLSIFAGRFTLDAAENICSDSPLTPQLVLDLLGRLVDRSLVKVEHSREGERYSILETLREYGREKLAASGEKQELHRRHADYFTRIAEETEPKIKGPEQTLWLDYLDADLDNFRAAWEFGMDRDQELALRLTSALMEYWLRRGNLGEGRDWSAKLLARTEAWGASAKRAQAWSITGWLAFFQHDFGAARTLLETSLATARQSGDRKRIGFVLQWLGWTITLMGDREYPLAQEMLEECLAFYQDAGEEWDMAMAMFHLAWLTGFQHQHSIAEDWAAKSLALFQKIGDKYWICGTIGNLGEWARQEGNYVLARIYYEQAMSIARELGGLRLRDTCSRKLGWVLLHDGDARGASSLFRENLDLASRIGSREIVAFNMAGLAGVQCVAGHPREAVRLFGALASLREQIEPSNWMLPADRREVDKYIDLATRQLDETAFNELWAAGRAMTMEQAMAFAFENSGV